MFRNVVFGLMCFCMVMACKESEMKNGTIITAQEKDSVITEPVIRPIGETLLPESRKKVENWKAYQELDKFLENYYTALPQEALNLSTELATISKQLKDSLEIKRFKEPDVQIRLNVLYNSVLRLEDMASIPNISDKEVLAEINQILDAFSALNAKINNITRKEEIEKQIKELENKINQSNPEK